VELKLTLAVVGPSEIRRSVRELAGLDDYFVASAARQNTDAAGQPRITQLLDELARANGINLLEAGQRKKLSEALNQVLKDAPSLHISFAREPSPKALEKIVSWFRDNIDKNSLLQIGLQPSIAAGCVLRTSNQLFDMSIRAKLDKHGSTLLSLIAGASK